MEEEGGVIRFIDALIVGSKFALILVALPIFCGYDTPNTTTCTLIFIGIIICLLWARAAVQPPDPPPLTSRRVLGGYKNWIKLRDGRYLSYNEYGYPKKMAKHKIVFIHGFDCCRHHTFIASNLSPVVVESLGVYIVSFDRPGYGESDPNPKGTLESLTLDIEELADQLGLGSKFYVVGFSMGAQLIWSCLKYIPHRLAGAALLAPMVNYWWRCFSEDLSEEAYNRQFLRDKLTLRVAHHIPSLTYWWNTRKWFPSSSVIAGNPALLSSQDVEILSNINHVEEEEAQVRQQGEFESIHRDLNIGFGKWEFDLIDIKNPFPNNEGSVHLWQGDEDRFVPVTLQRHIAKKLPWIHYHELSGAGHMFPLAGGMNDAILVTLLVGN